MPTLSNDDSPLDFGFIKNPPGQLISIGSHRLHVNCRGDGNITVLFEAGLGGSSMEWQPIQNLISPGIVTCAYDRAGYAWSDPSPYPRDAMQLAREANQLLDALGHNGPVILVGHSFGGFIVRLLADLRPDRVAGIILVDSSHEDQIKKFEQLGGRSPMPEHNRDFVITHSSVPENLPDEIRRKIQALARMRKTYNATHAEMGLFRQSARQVSKRRHTFDFPVTVMPRGLDPLKDNQHGKQKSKIWMQLQHDLATLSSVSRNIIEGSNSGHHVHIDEPDLVVDAVTSLIRQYKTPTQ